MPVTLQSIAISQPATKLSYTVGESLDISGLVVTGTYSNNMTQTETITAANISGFDSSTPATSQTLTLTVGGKTTSYVVSINPVPVTLQSIAITTRATKLSYTVGESLDISGLIVTGTYSDNTTRTETVTAANITGFDSSTAAASQTLTITVNGKTTSYTICINGADVAEQRVFTNWNGDNIASNPPNATSFTLTNYFALTFMNTYHNAGTTEAPGTFSLRHEDGTVYGPWTASGGYSSLICYVNFKGGGDEGYSDALGNIPPSSQYPILKPGTYTMIDSHPGTWSYNGTSGNSGFLQVKGYCLNFAATDNISSSFTDPQFKQVVWEWLGNTGTPGAFSRQDLTDRMAAKNYTLNAPGKNIVSLAGLEHFAGTGLTTLNCSMNQLASLPVLPDSLTALYCSTNRLISLPALPAGLTTLDCSSNYLDVWTGNPGSVKAALDAFTGGTKTVTPQYRLNYTGAALMKSPGQTTTLNMNLLPRQQSDDNEAWTNDPTATVASDLLFSSSNVNVATVNSSGMITAVGIGNCTIFATWMGTDGSSARAVIPLTVANDANLITGTAYGIMISGKVASVPAGTKVDVFKNGLSVSPGSTAEILTAAGGTAVSNQAVTDLTSMMVVRVTAQNGSTAEYAIYDKAICKLEDLRSIDNNLAGRYILANDLDFNNDASYTSPVTNRLAWTSGAGWSPIKFSTAYFNGLLDGNGHSIAHLYIRSANSNLGLFDRVEGSGVIKNLGLVNAHIEETATGSDIGTLAGALYSSIINCYATGTVIGTGNQVGGLVGSNNDGQILACSTNVTVSGNNAVGGISGKCGSNGPMPSIQNSYALGDVTGTGNNIGGIIGQALTGNLINVYAAGTVSGGGVVGGLAGYWNDSGIGNSVMQNSFALNDAISVGGGSAIGRIAGASANAANITNCFGNSAMSLPTSNSGLNGGDISLAAARQISAYSAPWSMDFAGSGSATIWVINNGNAFPWLRNQPDLAGPGMSADTTAPVLSGVNASGITASGANINLTSSEAGTCYHLIYNAADPAPTQQVIKDQGTAVVKGITPVSAGSSNINLTGLSPSTAYNAYLVVEDGEHNASVVESVYLQTTPLTLGDLPIGTVVKDSSASWEHRSGNGYVFQTGDATKPVEWVVVAKNHADYPANSVTLIAKELIAKQEFDTGTNVSANGSNHWGNSGTANGSIGIRPWLNTTFHDLLSTNFKNNILATNVVNKSYDGLDYTTSDKVFLPSATEMGYANATPITSEIGTSWNYFATNASRVATIFNNVNTANWYWTRSPMSVDSNQVCRVGSDGSITNGCSAKGNGDGGVRPVVNLRTDVCVTAAGEIIFP